MTGNAGLISYNDIEEARERIAPIIRPTPVILSDALSTLAGRELRFKGEHLQRTGSYKIRGAYNHVAQLPPGKEVVAASAGNHAQGVALAASLTKRRSTIFMPVTASLPKIEATKAYGADVRLEGEVIDDCLREAKRYAAETGAVFVPPFDHPHIIAGQGTLGIEITEQAPQTQVVVVPIGGGGLISGVATALAKLRPDIKVYGVEAAGAPAMTAALEADRCVRLEDFATMADGIAKRSVSDLTLAHTKEYVEEVFTVSEEEISRSVVLLLERAKAVVEPAAAVGLAALLSGKIPGNETVTAVLSGGNVDPLLLGRLIAHGMTAAGRYMVLQVIIDDRPGGLANLTASIAKMGLNVLNVEHHRSRLDLAVDEVEVVFTVETRDPDHRDEVVRTLSQQGYQVELVT